MIAMKFAIPTNDEKGLSSQVSADYSKCKYFLLVNIDDGRAGPYESMPNEVPAEVEEIRGVTAFILAGKGVQAAIVHKIVEKERLSLVGNNIRIFLGAKGTASEAIKQYLGGQLTESSSCKSGKDSGICEC
jgi:predicted Fe-Mo cluster-binding NifX family protein